MNRGEDTYFNIAVLEHVNTIYFSDQNFYHYRRSRSDSLYSTFHRDIYEIQMSSDDRKQMEEEAKAHGGI